MIMGFELPEMITCSGVPETVRIAAWIKIRTGREFRKKGFIPFKDLKKDEVNFMLTVNFDI